MSHLLPGPAQEPGAMIGKHLLQLPRRHRLLDGRLLTAGDVEIDQRQMQRRQLSCLAQECAVDQQLHTMNRPVAGRNAGQIAPIRLELLEALRGRVVAVRAPAHPEVAEVTAEDNLGFIFRPAAAGNERMAFHALSGAGRRSETQVEIPCLGREVAQSAHGNRVLSFRLGPTHPASLKEPFAQRPSSAASDSLLDETQGPVRSEARVPPGHRPPLRGLRDPQSWSLDASGCDFRGP